MAFASNFGRILSPTFQPNSQAKKAGGWWLAGGIEPDDCIAAYQPKGAASYAASLDNLTGNATYDAAAGSAPDWDSTNGWKFNGTSHYLTTGITMADNYSLIIKITEYDYANSAFMGTFIGGSLYSGGWQSLAIMAHKYASNKVYYECGAVNVQPVVGTSTTKVLAITHDVCYLDGSYVTTISSPGTVGGVCKIGNGINGYAKFYATAAAIYSAKLTDTQISALTTAINLL